MADPELRSDEKVLVRTPGVYVKSIPFEGILTNKRIILIDRAKNLLPPKEIPLVTIKEVESGENAIRDQIITLSVMAKTGETRQMILTFSRQTGGNRIKERDAWARIIKENASSSFDHVIRKVIPGPEPAPRRTEPVAGPRYEVVPPSLHAPTPSGDPREVGIALDEISPVRRSATTGPGAAVPQPSGVTVADASFPDTSLFCLKCGNKVPAGSVFCNRCGSPIAQVPPVSATVQTPPAPPVGRTTAFRPIDEDIQSIEPLIERSTAKIPADALRPAPSETSLKQSTPWDDEKEPEPASPPDTEVANEKAPKRGFLPRLFSAKSPDAAPPVEKTPAARPIDEDIQSIEPLIERSTVTIPADAPQSAPAEAHLRPSISTDDGKEPEPAALPEAQAPAEKPAEKGFLPGLFSAKSADAAAPVFSSKGTSDTPPPPKPPRGRRGIPDKQTVLTAAVVLVVILLVAAAALFIYPILTGGSPATPSGPGDVTPASPSSTLKTSGGTIVIRETQAPVIPPTGTYVHINYLGGFKGSYGIPDMITTVPGNSGDRVWEVENATNNTVQATFEKLDGSAHELLVEIYKDGKALTRGTTTVGHGSVALSVDMVTGIAATPVTSGRSSTVLTGTATAITTSAAVKTAALLATTTTVTMTPATTTAAANTTTAAP